MADRMAEHFQVEFLSQQGVMLSVTDARILRSAAVTLHRWDQRKRGFITKFPEQAAVELIRDEKTNIPYFAIHTFGRLRTIYERVEDRERAAEILVQNICDRYGLYFYRHPDSNECPLYIGRSPLTDKNYSINGYAVGSNIRDKDELFPQRFDVGTTWDMTA